MANGGGRVYGGSGSSNSSLGGLIQSHRTDPPLDSLFLSGSGSRSMVSFEDVRGTGKQFFRSFGGISGEDSGNMIDDELEDYFNEHQPGKKRRLSVDQVQFLEKSFEVENKLEPERKVQLAKDLGLQPRQVAIWFQNRRARWKTKQMEKDYDVLQASFNALKSDYESLVKETDKLKAEVLELSEKSSTAKGEKEKEISSEVSENSENKFSGEGGEEENPVEKTVIAESEEGSVSKISTIEDIGSGKSDIFDSDSPRFADGVHSNPLFDQHGDSSYVFEADQASDLSQDEEDDLTRSLLPQYIFPKLEDVDYSDDPPESSCNFGFPVEDHHAFWSWSY